MKAREDGWHCKDCWDKFHNGLTDKDWLDLDAYIKSGAAEECIKFRKEYRAFVQEQLS